MASLRGALATKQSHKRLRDCHTSLCSVRNDVIIIILIFLMNTANAFAKIGNKVYEDEKQYGKELERKQFSENKKDFAGKIYYNFPQYSWQILALYRDGKAISETVRPRGNKIKKDILTEKEANVIADIIYPRKERGLYKKQIKNANFISHFFDNGVVSYEMKLDRRRRNHVGVIGVRAVLYSDGAMFKDIKVNAYH